VLLLALGSVDLLTAPRNDVHSLTAVGLALAVGLVPFFLTNLAISGNPVAPPRMLPAYDGGAAMVSGASGAGAGTTAGASAGTTTSSVSTGLAVMVVSLEAAIGRLTGTVADGLAALDPTRLYHVFIRSGHIPGVDYSMTGGQTVELTILESAPLLAALVGVPVAAAARWRPQVGLLREPAAIRRRLRAPVVATDLFVVVYVLLLSLIYLPMLPLHATITVRYLTPIVPFLLYGVVRLAVVREAIAECGRRCAVAAVVFGVGAVALPVAAFGPAGLEVGTVVQSTALVNLFVAALVAAWALAASYRRTRPSPATGALVLALALAAMGSFLLLSGLEYFGHGREFALPVARAVEQLLPIR
jgi:hypothetical protein